MASADSAALAPDDPAWVAERPRPLWRRLLAHRLFMTGAVILGIGLAGVNALRAEGEDKAGVRDAVDFIAELRQTTDLSTLPVGREEIGP